MDHQKGKLYMQPMPKNLNTGFTLVEVLVISPILIIFVAIIVGLMINLTGDVMQSRERAAMIYDTQTAFNQIENDVRISTQFVGSTGTLPSPQGANNGTSAFYTNSSTLVLEQLSTTKNSYDSSRQLLYYDNTPNPCTGQYTSNEPVKHLVIYYLHNDELRRRTVVNFAGKSVCGGVGTNLLSPNIWQKNTCSVADKTYCVATDMVVAKSISSVNFTYFTDANTPTQTTTISNTTKSLRVDLTTTAQRAGKIMTHTASMRALRIN